MIVRRTILRHLESDCVTEVLEAANGRQAIDLFEQHLPELVTMDITMPEVDGLECVSSMVLIAPEVRILVISALADEETAIEAVERGANGYVCKPFTASELNTAFEELREGL